MTDSTRKDVHKKFDLADTKVPLFAGPTVPKARASDETQPIPAIVADGSDRTQPIDVRNILGADPDNEPTEVTTAPNFDDAGDVSDSVPTEPIQDAPTPPATPRAIAKKNPL